MPFDNNDYPGYIGYNIIANEALQTGVHCCDIAMHSEDVKNNQLLKSALEFLEQPAPRVFPFFNSIADEGDAIIAAQSILNKFLQQTRRDLCEFAVTKIQDPNESLICRTLLASEIKTAILEGRDFPVAELLSEELANECATAMEQYYLNNEGLLYNFCEKPDVCIKYIQHYYLVGNKQSDNPLSAKMFIVPAPDSTGMLNIAAMQLKRKIIVISASNGEPFTTADYSNGTKAPVYIGYDGRLHFVELRSYTLTQLDKIANHEGSNLKKAIYESIMAIIIAQQTREIQPQQLNEAQQLLEALRIKYAEIVTAEKTFDRDQEKFMQLLIKKPATQKNNMQIIDKLELLELYNNLLKKQCEWLNTTVLSDIEDVKSQQRESQKQLLQQIISDKIFDLDESVNKRLVNNIFGTSESLIALDAKKAVTIDMAQQLKDFFVANAYQESTAQVANEAVSWFQIFKSFVSKFVTAILYPFQSILFEISNFITNNLYTTKDTKIVVPTAKTNLTVEPVTVPENSPIHEIRKINSFTPLLNIKKQQVESPVPAPIVKNKQHFPLM